MLVHDQLKAEIEKGNVFDGFQEGKPSLFRPTFKVRRHQDTLEYNPQRAPAYCDRYWGY